LQEETFDLVAHGPQVHGHTGCGTVFSIGGAIGGGQIGKVLGRKLVDVFGLCAECFPREAFQNLRKAIGDAKSVDDVHGGEGRAE
jgi:hypothetical protein